MNIYSGSGLKMKNTRALVMILVSLLLGVVAMFLAGMWINEQTKIESSKVTVALHDINPGTRLTIDMLSRIDWPGNQPPAGSFADISQLDGRVVRTPLVRGELVLESKLAPVGASGGLSGIISEGKRAITVKVNEVIGVAGFALPGNVVDVLVNANDDDRKPFSKLVLEKILVLAVAQDVGRDGTKPKVVTAVTLEVTPEEAEILDLSRGIGTLSLVLRNQVDDKYVETSGRRISDLLKQEPVTEAAVAESKVIRRERVEQSIAIIRGTNKSNAILK